MKEEAVWLFPEHVGVKAPVGASAVVVIFFVRSELLVILVLLLACCTRYIAMHVCSSGIYSL